MAWNWNYAYAFVSFVVGALAGFQAIYERYGDESGTSVNTLPGVGYLFSRGLVPAFFFFLFYLRYQVQNNFALFGLAIAFGLGTEAVLRSQIQIRSSKPAKGALATENTFLGFFNLLDWYQKLILELINTRIAAKRQKIVHQAVRRIPQGTPFNRVCELVATNADALSDYKERKTVKDEIARQLDEYTREVTQHGGMSTSEIEERYEYKLAYWIYHNAGRWHGLKVLFKFTR